MKTSELTGAALDWAVAQAEVKTWAVWRFVEWHSDGDLNYSTDWALGGAIIERERIELRGDGDDGWIACDNLNLEQTGTTPLEAAMRCYVASKLGDEVEVPEELMSHV